MLEAYVANGWEVGKNDGNPIRCRLRGVEGLREFR